MTSPNNSPYDTEAPAIRTRLSVLGVPIDVITFDAAVEKLIQWGANRESRAVYVCNVHSVITATEDPGFLEVITNADLATADGAPVAWMLRRQGAKEQRRVSGPDLMLKTCERASEAGISIFLYGNTEDTNTRLAESLRKQWPHLDIAGSIAPPFRPLTNNEEEQIVETINKSGAGIVWVSLGCPKQERWISVMKGRLRVPMVGVGAAFDFFSGNKNRAPPWMRRHGLEWLHRLASDPIRLAKRYIITNSIFLAKVIFHRPDNHRGLA